MRHAPFLSWNTLVFTTSTLQQSGKSQKHRMIWGFMFSGKWSPSFLKDGKEGAFVKAQSFLMAFLFCFHYICVFRSTFVQNSPLKRLSLNNHLDHLLNYPGSHFPPLVVLYWRSWAVSAACSCSAVIIGSERSIFSHAGQSCDSCVGGRHEVNVCSLYVCMDAFERASSCKAERKWCIH